MSPNTFFKDFLSPQAEFRAAIFWAWNSALDPEECRWQIRLMKQAGLGGFFMHSRIGLETRYLGNEFLTCVKACVDEAKKLGMKAYLYDEDRWPSGSAGGLVTCNPKFRMRELHVLRGKETALPDGAKLLGTYRVRFEGEILAEYQRISDAEDLEDGELLRCYYCPMASSPWYNNQTYLDTMNPEAVRAFINTTHERYAALLDSEFGQTIPGIFTDEPSYVNYFVGDALPWTEVFPEKFQQRYHYDLAEHLPEIFYQTPKTFSQARHDYYELATTLFTESFVKQIGEWCETHHIALTGHVLCEDYLRWQTRACGSAMRAYPFMGMPGIDLISEYWIVFNTIKQCVSVAHQLGKERRLTETYGCTGWDFPLLGHKALGDWQYALGINFRCQHLALYSMKGEAKRDYPASISFQSPWFGHYSHIEDYFARLAAVMVPGEEIRDILVVHSAEAVWGVHSHFGENKESERIDKDFLHLTYLLLDAHLDFDFGDEKLMAELGSVEKQHLIIGRGRYKAVIIPDVPYLAPTTIKLLELFQTAGGTVYCLGKTLEQFPHAEMNDLPGLLAPVRRVSLALPDGDEAHGVLYRLSQSKYGTVLFLCNTSMDYSDNFLEATRVWERRIAYPDVELTLTMPEAGTLYELHPEDGSVSEIEHEYSDGAYHCRFALEALASKLFFIGENPGRPLLKAEERRYTPASSDIKLTGYQLSEENVLVLDHPVYAIGDGVAQGRSFVLDLDKELRTRLGVQLRGSQMVQPWCAPKTAGKSLGLKLSYSFKVDVIPQGPCYLVVEEPEHFTFELNGQKLPSVADNGFWVDPAMRKILLPAGFLRRGENTLCLAGNYCADWAGLESIYLIGDFGVEQDCIVDLPKCLNIGNWVTQRLPYYSGNVNYEFHFTPEAEKRYAIGIDEWAGTEVEVAVNGEGVRCLTAFDGIINLTNLKPGKDNRVDITVYGHRRNSMGPFWAKGKSLLWIGFQIFSKRDVEERQLVPCGLLSKINLYNF